MRIKLKKQLVVFGRDTQRTMLTKNEHDVQAVDLFHMSVATAWCENPVASR
jgi:hypothetical protein